MRKDVVCVYSAEGWKQFISKIDSLDDFSKARVRKWINNYDVAKIAANQDRLLKFNCVDTGSFEFLMFNGCNCNIDSEEFFEMSVKADVRINRYFEYKYNNCSDLVGDIFTTITENATIKTSTIVDNHTCVLCHNTKCNKTEKSCWKCGHPI